MKKQVSKCQEEKNNILKYYLPEYTGWGIKWILRLTMLETFLLTYVLNRGKNQGGPKKTNTEKALYAIVHAVGKLYSSCFCPF